jgi:hypothetical protein
MAVQKCAVTMQGPTNSLRLGTWQPLANGDTGEPFQQSDWADRCFQISGTFGAGGSISIEGSNDGANWSVLSDMNGNAMTYSSATVKQANEAPMFVRPHVTSGDGTTSLNVTVLGRKINSLL